MKPIAQLYPIPRWKSLRTLAEANAACRIRAFWRKKKNRTSFKK